MRPHELRRGQNEKKNYYAHKNDGRAARRLDVHVRRASRLDNVNYYYYTFTFPRKTCEQCKKKIFREFNTIETPHRSTIHEKSIKKTFNTTSLYPR